MNDIERLSIQAALKKMIDCQYFDITTIDQVLKVTKTVPNGRLYDTMRLLHCIHYRDMDPELLEQLPMMLAEIFKGPLLELPGINFVAGANGRMQLSITRPH